MSFYYVVDTGDDGEDCSLSWNSETEKAEWFHTRKAAKKRAKELAEGRPGVRIEVVKTDMIVKCKVGKVTVKDA